MKSVLQWQHLPFLSVFSISCTTNSLSFPFSSPSVSSTIQLNSWNNQVTPLLVLALTVLKIIAPIVRAYYLASQCSTQLIFSSKDSSKRSSLLPTSANMTSLGAVFFTSSAHTCKLSNECLLVTSYTSRAIFASWQQILAIERYLSWPAVSQIWNLTILPETCQMVLQRKAAPSVAGGRGLNSSATKRLLILVLPTPDGPTITTFTAIGSTYLLKALLPFIPSNAFPIRLLQASFYDHLNIPTMVRLCNICRCSQFAYFVLFKGTHGTKVELCLDERGH